MINIDKWRIYFVTARDQGWWSWAFPKGMQHCFAAAPFIPGYWVVVESAWRGIEFTLVDEREFEQLHRHAMDVLHGRYLWIENDPKRRGRVYFPLHCATFLAHLLGVKPWKALTPPMLYRTLTKLEASRHGEHVCDH